jgi:spore coat polysaccharide biosynthesis predicted glycosyltransferase SpsG
MATRAKKLNLYLRFDSGGWDGLGHAQRSIELARELKKKFNVILCTNIITKKLINIKNFNYFFKKKNEKEENYLLRISKEYKNALLFVDKNYDYSKHFLKVLNTKYQKIFFYQNFCQGIQEENIIINPTPNLNSSIGIQKKFRKNKIYNGNKYLIVPKSPVSKKKNYLGISLGGSDPKNISIKLLRFLVKINWKFSTYLFIGAFSNIEKKIKKLNLPKNIKISKFNKQKFQNSRLAICSPGITAFELLTKNVFALYISHSKTHFNLGNYIEKKYKFSKNLNIFNNVNIDNFSNYLYYYWNNKKKITGKIPKKKIIFNNSCKRVLEIINYEANKK